MGVRMVPVVSAADMAQAVKADAQAQDIIIKAAAVADYRPAVTADEKLKKKDDEMSLVLERTEDILAWLGAHRRPGQFLCGFPWRPNICWRIPGRSWRRRRSI